jgi:large-conductance mechanosensitive channel
MLEFENYLNLKNQISKKFKYKYVHLFENCLNLKILKFYICSNFLITKRIEKSKNIKPRKTKPQKNEKQEKLTQKPKKIWPQPLTG